MVNKKLKQDYIQEAYNLKQAAKKNELKKLKFKTLDETSPDHCIYGQMTGSSVSARANFLISQCCTKVYNCNQLKRVNLSAGLRRDLYFSPIEMALFTMTEEEKKNLINFLKGNQDDL